MVFAVAAVVAVVVILRMSLIFVLRARFEGDVMARWTLQKAGTLRARSALVV